MGILKNEDKDIKAMQGLHIYHGTFSNCSMRVRITAAEKKIAWESHVVNLMKRENLEDWFLRINPKGLVPVIICDGVVVNESNDIMLYLEDKYPDPSLIPSEADQAAQVKKWVNLASEIHLSTIKTYMYGTLGTSSKRAGDMDRYRQIQPDKELLQFHEEALAGIPNENVKKAAARIHELFQAIDTELNSHKWLVGDSFTMADIAWFPQYFMLNSMGFPFSKYSNVIKWAKEMEQRPSFKPGVADWLPPVPIWLVKWFIKIREGIAKWTGAGKV